MPFIDTIKVNSPFEYNQTLVGLPSRSDCGLGKLKHQCYFGAILSSNSSDWGLDNSNMTVAVGKLELQCYFDDILSNNYYDWGLDNSSFIAIWVLSFTMSSNSPDYRDVVAPASMLV